MMLKVFSPRQLCEGKNLATQDREHTCMSNYKVGSRRNEIRGHLASSKPERQTDNFARYMRVLRSAVHRLRLDAIGSGEKMVGSSPISRESGLLLSNHFHDTPAFH